MRFMHLVTRVGLARDDYTSTKVLSVANQLYRGDSVNHLICFYAQFLEQLHFVMQLAVVNQHGLHSRIPQLS